MIEHLGSDVGDNLQANAIDQVIAKVIADTTDEECKEYGEAYKAPNLMQVEGQNVVQENSVPGEIEKLHSLIGVIGV